ncbi:hypothetical protein B4098_0950 [Heyndrickxia coagulans]|uniref:Uncharacterized protein n=1 Tax=Heyndrickxia coagulans TaxID=1398 RepID=A0A150K9U7_HEYCO|nr:hypothetical protein B4098_0950 [Heyndrickxia coagulans]KYC66343.1 hypothetical protein B4100_1069 [Heyndrickxia coagulans]KYC71398.1 hypothetical protein B4099_1136 [Heyndrickxia coagulans]
MPVTGLRLCEWNPFHTAFGNTLGVAFDAGNARIAVRQLDRGCVRKSGCSRRALDAMFANLTGKPT